MGCTWTHEPDLCRSPSRRAGLRPPDSAWDIFAVWARGRVRSGGGSALGRGYGSEFVFEAGALWLAAVVRNDGLQEDFYEFPVELVTGGAS